MSKIHRKRLVLGLSSLGIVGAVAALAIGGTMALFSSAASPSTSTFSAGTVILTGSSTNATNQSAPTNLGSCTFTNVEPGGVPGPSISGAQPGYPYVCDYNLAYNGSVPAWVYLDVSTTSAAGHVTTPLGSTSSYGGEALLDGTATGLGVEVFSAATNNSSSQVFTIGTVTPGTGQTCNPGGTSPSYCTSTSSSANDQAIGNSPVNAGWTDTIQVEGLLPITAGNVYEGGTATVTVQATAVQSDNNSGNDCYTMACSNYGPIAQSVAVDASTSTVVVTYNQPVVFGFNNSGGVYTPIYTDSKPAGFFLVQDVTQPLVSGSPDQCTVSSATTAAGSDQVTLDLGTCNGNTPQVGDLFDVTMYNAGGPFLTGTTPANNPPFALTPQVFWNQPAS
jgi:predicted ribosomally synthesized peptide with SipW-like signal peptide